MIVSPDEFIPAREASRSLGLLVDRLEAGEMEKAVLVYRNQPRAVLLSVEAYERLMLWVPLSSAETQGLARAALSEGEGQ